MPDIDSKDPNINRSIADFWVSYTTGVHTTGRKKGQRKIEKENIAIIVPSLDQHYVRNYIQEYCIKKNMDLIKLDVQPFPGKRHFEFNCQICGEFSIKFDPMNQEFCSEYCQSKSRLG